MLMGCNGKEDPVKGEIDLSGMITKIDSSSNQILLDDKNYGLVWVALNKNGNIADFEVDDEIAVWIEGEIKESSPAQAKALHIEKILK